MSAAQIVMVTNWANVSNDSAPPTSVFGPWSVTSSHSTIASTPAAPAAAAVTAAYSPRGHCGVSAPTSSRNSAAPTRIRIGESANHWTSGPTKLWARSVIPRPPLPRGTSGTGALTSVRDSTWAMRRSTLGSMRSSNGFG